MGLIKKVAIGLFIGGLGLGYFLGYYINTDRRYKIMRDQTVPYIIDKKSKRFAEVDEFTFLDSQSYGGADLGDKLFRKGLEKIKHEVGDSIDSLLGYEE